MAKLLSFLMHLNYVTLSDSVQDGIRTIISVRRQRREDIMPPGLILIKCRGSAYVDVAVYYALETGLDDATFPNVVQGHGLNYKISDNHVHIYYRLFDSGFSMQYVKHVLKNLGACLLTVMETFEKDNKEGLKCQ